MPKLKKTKKYYFSVTLSDVIDAINRAKLIMQRNEQNGYILQEYKGYKYYKENPSLDIWKVIEVILRDCELIKQRCDFIKNKLSYDL